MAIEYLNTKQVSEIMGGMKLRQTRELMHKVGIIKVGHGLIRRDALDRYLADLTEETCYTKPLLEIPIKPKYDRYARSGKEKYRR